MNRILLAATVAAAALVSTPALARPMTATDMHMMRRLGAPSVSPDGRNLIYSVAEGRPAAAVTSGAGDKTPLEMNATGTALLYSTYLGGSGLDGVELFEVMMGDPRSFPADEAGWEQLLADKGAKQAPNPKIALPDWLEDTRT